MTSEYCANYYLDINKEFHNFTTHSFFDIYSTSVNSILTTVYQHRLKLIILLMIFQQLNLHFTLLIAKDDSTCNEYRCG